MDYERKSFVLLTTNNSIYVIIAASTQPRLCPLCDVELPSKADAIQHLRWSRRKQ